MPLGLRSSMREAGVSARSTAGRERVGFGGNSAVLVKLVH
jgi:hypothetical protein